MAWGYKHYERMHYTERVYRQHALARVQLWVDTPGLYTDLTISPIAAPSDNPRAVLADQVFAPQAGDQYLNPDGRRLGFEWLVWDDTNYTVSLKINNTPYSFAIAALPISPTPLFTVQQSIPYTIGGLAGYVLHGVINGQYQAGGVVLETPNPAEHVAAQTSVLHNLYRDQQGRWRLQLYNADGTEYAPMTVLQSLPLTLTIWSRYR